MTNLTNRTIQIAIRHVAKSRKQQMLADGEGRGTGRLVLILKPMPSRVTVTNRDLRRTWKTLAGKAGVPKEIRDRIQNHAFQDVSSKSYDRWSYMPEKRAGMEKWNAYVGRLLAKGVITIAV
jgi:hypothetical protein